MNKPFLKKMIALICSFAIVFSTGISSVFAVDSRTLSSVSAAQTLSGSFTSDKGGQVPVGTTLNLTAQGFGGSGNYTYYFGYSDGTQWNVMNHPNASNNTIQWFAAKAGTYNFAVDIYDAAGGKATIWLHIVVTATTLTGSFQSNQSSTVLAGTTVTLTGQGIGGDGSYTYYFGYSDGAAWNVMNHPDAKSNSIQWTPTKAGTYNFAVDIYDGIGQKVTKWINITVIYPSLDGTLKSDQSSTVQTGSTITLTGQGIGGDGNYTYYFGYSDGTAWNVMDHPNAKSNSIQWTPTKAGTYNFAVDIYDGTGNKVTKWINITVTYPSLDGTIKSDQSSIIIGSAITLTGQGIGGDGNYTYNFSYQDTPNGQWNIIDNQNTKTNSVQWIPTKVGTYKLAVDIYDGTGNKVTKYVSITVTYPALDGTLKSDQSSIIIGSAITLTGQGIGGDGNYSYNFSYQDTPSGQWNIIDNPDTKSNSVQWTPAKVGTYKLAVDIYDGTGNKVTKYVSVTVTYPPLDGTLKSDQTSIIIGSAISLTGQGIGGDGNYTYNFSYQDTPNGQWSIIDNQNTTSNSVQWTPAKVGTYKLAVDIYDGTGNKVTKCVSVTVTYPPLDGTLKSDQTSIIIGSAISLTGQGIGGDGNYTYNFSYQDTPNGQWNIIDNQNATSNSVQWIPTKVGTYKFAVDIYDGTGNKVTKYVSVTVTYPPLEGTLKSNQPSTVQIGSTITLTAQGIGGDGDYVYYFAYGEDNNWTLMNHPDAKSNSIQWTPTKAGVYNFMVSIYDGTSQCVTKKISITVN